MKTQWKTGFRCCFRLAWLPALAAVIGCSESASPTAPSGEAPFLPVATVERRMIPDSNTFVTQMGVLPRTEIGETGEWLPEYSDPTMYRLRTAGWFISMRNAAEIPVFVRTETPAKAGSVQIGLVQASGRIAVFGLRRHEVWLRVELALAE